MHVDHLIFARGVIRSNGKGLPILFDFTCYVIILHIILFDIKCYIIILPMLLFVIKCFNHNNTVYTLSQQARDVEPMLVQCWATVCDAGPTLNQHWFNASCLCLVDIILYILFIFFALKGLPTFVHVKWYRSPMSFDIKGARYLFYIKGCRLHILFAMKW